MDNITTRRSYNSYGIEKHTTSELTLAILEAEGIQKDLASLSRKEAKKIQKKCKRLLKELEFLKRTGGMTLIVKKDYIITTYDNDSMNRKALKNKYKVKY